MILTTYKYNLVCYSKYLFFREVKNYLEHILSFLLVVFSFNFFSLTKIFIKPSYDVLCKVIPVNILKLEV